VNVLVDGRGGLPVAVFWVDLHHLARFHVNVVPVDLRLASVDIGEGLHLGAGEADGFLH
jgi:hypothetical protein